jgi:hypothetical protein
MIKYECNSCKEEVEAPNDVVDVLIGEWREEKKNTYIFVCNKCIEQENIVP